MDLMQTTPRIESLLKRDRAIVISGVVAVVAIAWGYTIYVAQSNADMGTSMGMAMGNVRSWSGADFSRGAVASSSRRPGLNWSETWAYRRGGDFKGQSTRRSRLTLRRWWSE